MSESTLDAVFERQQELSTSRLVLRALERTDAEALLAQGSDERVLAHIPKPALTTIADAELVIEQCRSMFETRSGIAWAGVTRSCGEMIGTLGFNRIEAQHKRAEIGGALSPAYWGTGVAREALESVMHYGFTVMDLHTIEAKVNPANRSTLAWLRAFGFEQEGYFKEYGCWNGTYLDLAMYTRFNPAH